MNKMCEINLKMIEASKGFEGMCGADCYKVAMLILNGDIEEASKSEAFPVIKEIVENDELFKDFKEKVEFVYRFYIEDFSISMTATSVEKYLGGDSEESLCLYMNGTLTNMIKLNAYKVVFLGKEKRYNTLEKSYKLVRK